MRIRRTALIILFAAGAASAVFGQAADLIAFNSSWTLHDLAASESIPVRKLAEELGVDLTEVADRTFADLEVTREIARDAVTRYREGEGRFVGGIIVVGMIIVFVSLLVVALLIGLFKHLHLFDRVRPTKRKRAARSVLGTITSSGDMSEQSIAAVITAIFLHEDEVDAGNRLLLTWRRASASRWRTEAPMPNEQHTAARSSRR